MALSYDEMQQLFEQIGFKGFSMRAYDADMEYLISEAMEDNAKAVYDRRRPRRSGRWAE